MCISTAQACTRNGCPALGPFYENRGALSALLEISVKYDQGLVEVLVRICCEDPDGILSEVLA